MPPKTFTTNIGWPTPYEDVAAKRYDPYRFFQKEEEMPLYFFGDLGDIYRQQARVRNAQIGMPEPTGFPAGQSSGQEVPKGFQPGEYKKPKGGVTDINTYMGAVATGVGLAADAYNTANSYTENTFHASPVNVPTSQQGLARLSRQEPYPDYDEYDFGARDFFACGGKVGHKYGHGGGYWGDALSGAATGAAAGAVFGPWGALAGGVIGLGSSIIGNEIKNSNARREASLYEDQLRKEEANRAYALGLGARQVGFDRNSFFDRYYVHENGGPMRSVMDGGNGVTKVEAGGSHERNSLGGVPMGMAPDGLPNLVEEGEVKWEKENYIFSKRLKPTKRLLKDHVLTNKKWEGKSYAEIAEAIQKGSEERENDPTARQTVDELLGRLMDAQEETRMEKAMRKMQKAMEAMSPEEQAAFLGSMMEQPPMQPAIPPQAPIQQPVDVGMGQGLMQTRVGYVEPMAEGQPVGYEQPPMMAMGGHLFEDAGKISFKNGAWGNESGSAWNGSVDAGWLQALAAAKAAGVDLATADRNTVAQYMRETEAYKKGTDWLKSSEDNMLRYLNDVIASPDAPVKAKTWAKKFVGDDGKWKSEVDHSYNKVFSKREDMYPGTYWKTPQWILDEIAPAAATAASTTPVTDPQTGIRYYIRNGNEYELIGDPEAYNQWVLNHAQYTSPYQFRTPTENGVKYTDYYVQAPQEAQPIPPFPRYSPWPGIANAGVALLGAWNVPDYEKANILDTYRPRPMDYNPIGNYLAYDPMDMDYLANGMRAGAAGTRAAINNRISPSTDAALLAADFNFVNGLGNAYEQVRQFNDKDRASVADFNRGTDQHNATAANEAEKVNFGLNQYDWDRVQKVADARDAASTLASTANSQAVTTAMSNLGEAYKDWYNTQGVGWLVEQNLFPGVTLGRRRKA